MKKYIFFLFIINIFAAFSQVQINSQNPGGVVGINTTNPLGIFHIDPNKNSPSIVSDDVIVDAGGNMGMGTTSPSAKVHVTVPTGSTAVRMVDGTQATDRILMSDANGNASWGVIKGSGGYSIQVAAYKSFPFNVSTIMPLDGANTRINIVTAGNYLVTIRWWGTTSVITGSQTVSAYFTLCKNGVNVDGIEYYVPIAVANSPITLTTSLMATNCVAGDYLEIYVMPFSGGQPWVINGPVSIRPSVVVFRM